ncbi:hypothetical protein HBI85_183810 [Parastagonospora nodorum]|nr:hypothetical protein HBI85_183810 [Parastagonospora nodorum]
MLSWTELNTKGTFTCTFPTLYTLPLTRTRNLLHTGQHKQRASYIISCRVSHKPVAIPACSHCRAVTRCSMEWWNANLSRLWLKKRVAKA